MMQQKKKTIATTAMTTSFNNCLVDNSYQLTMTVMMQQKTTAITTTATTTSFNNCLVDNGYQLTMTTN